MHAHGCYCGFTCSESHSAGLNGKKWITAKLLCHLLFLVFVCCLLFMLLANRVSFWNGIVVLPHLAETVHGCNCRFLRSLFQCRQGAWGTSRRQCWGRHAARGSPKTPMAPAASCSSTRGTRPWPPHTASFPPSPSSSGPRSSF